MCLVSRYIPSDIYVTRKYVSIGIYPPLSEQLLSSCIKFRKLHSSLHSHFQNACWNVLLDTERKNAQRNSESKVLSENVVGDPVVSHSHLEVSFASPLFTTSYSSATFYLFDHDFSSLDIRSSCLSPLLFSFLCLYAAHLVRPALPHGSSLSSNPQILMPQALTSAEDSSVYTDQCLLT